MIKIETNASEVVAALAGASKRTVNKAFSHSANVTISSSRTFILKALAESGLKRKIGAAALYFSKSTPETLTASLKDRGRKIPLAAFSPKSKKVKTARGRRIGVTILIGGNRELVPGGFLATLKSGKVGVFQRVGSERLPIKQMFAKQLSDLFHNTSGLPAATKTFANEIFRKSFKRDFEFYKSKEPK